VDNKTRIKVKDILNHPWVRNFEKKEIERVKSEVKQKMLLDSGKRSNEDISEINNNNNDNDDNNEYNNNNDDIKYLQHFQDIDSEEENIRNLESELLKAKIKAGKVSTKNVQFSDDNNKNNNNNNNHINNNNYMSYNQQSSSINSNNALKNKFSTSNVLDKINSESLKSLPKNIMMSNEDFSLLQNNLKDDSLFDKVLNQVQSGKRPKTKNSSKKSDESLKAKLNKSSYNKTKKKAFDYRFKDSNKEDKDEFRLAENIYMTTMNDNLKHRIESDEEIEERLNNLNKYEKPTKKSKTMLSSKNIRHIYSPAKFISISHTSNIKYIIIYN